MQKLNYETPAAELLTVAIEQGFAASATIGGGTTTPELPEDL